VVVRSGGLCGIFCDALFGADHVPDPAVLAHAMAALAEFEWTPLYKRISYLPQGVTDAVVNRSVGFDAVGWPDPARPPLRCCVNCGTTVPTAVPRTLPSTGRAGSPRGSPGELREVIR
jgi:hypothetical protein